MGYFPICSRDLQYLNYANWYTIVNPLVSLAKPRISIGMGLV